MTVAGQNGNGAPQRVPPSRTQGCNPVVPHSRINFQTEIPGDNLHNLVQFTSQSPLSSFHFSLTERIDKARIPGHQLHTLLQVPSTPSACVSLCLAVL